MSNTQNNPDPLAAFYALCTVVFGALAGVLIGLPVVLSDNADISIPTISAIGPLVIFGLIGGLIGFRKRKSRLFFYLTIITVLLLSSLLATKIG